MKCIPVDQHLGRFVIRSIVQSGLLVALGCAQWSAVPNGTVPRPDVKVLRLHLRNGSSVTLRSAFFSPDSIEGLAPDTTPQGSRIAVARADVDRIDVPHFDLARTGGLLVGMAAAGVVALVIVPIVAVHLFPPSS